ncbi:MAG: c-type cytochrome [Saprospiraceae bacterium]|nr:c-type cytochrome [Saprospiraceae bacterium]
MKLLTIMTIGVYFLTTTGYNYAQEPWDAPAKFAKMANPVKQDAAAIAEGKTLWVKHCQSCHGKKGLGDGSKAAQLKTEPGNFTKASFQSQTDGTLFYKTLEGRDDMPSFKKKIPDQEDIWKLIHFMRTLK